MIVTYSRSKYNLAHLQNVAVNLSTLLVKWMGDQILKDNCQHFYTFFLRIFILFFTEISDFKIQFVIKSCFISDFWCSKLSFYVINFLFLGSAAVLATFSEIWVNFFQYFGHTGASPHIFEMGVTHP
jgi:hypothetical protein